MTRLVRWTEAERAVEADLGVNEVRARIDKLHWPDRYEIVAALATPTTLPFTATAGTARALSVNVFDCPPATARNV